MKTSRCLAEVANLSFIIPLLLCLTDLAVAGVPLPRYEAIMKQQSQPTEELGLYDANDMVITMNVANFNETVLDQNHATLVEFYNTYCGHCRRFAPIYKAVAEELYPWREVVVISAIDCAAEENNGICRMYEVMGYPTLRYMGPGFQPNDKQYGQDLRSQSPDTIRSLVAGLVAAENQTANNTLWPNFQPVTENENAQTLFEGSSGQREYIALVYEAANSTLAIETALFLLQWPAVQVRRFNDASVAAKFKIDIARNEAALIDRKGIITPITTAQNTSLSYAKAIETALSARNITPRPSGTQQMIYASSTNTAQLQSADNKDIIHEVHRNKHFVYQADLEQSVRTVLHNEVPKVNEISGDRLLALQRFLAVLHRYCPLGANGKQLIGKLNDFVVQHNQKLTGKQFEEQLKQLENQHAPIYSSSHFVGCIGSSAQFRGYSCSLWTLFHFMTVQAAQTEYSQDPLEVLQAMHGYIKNFFGCSDCSTHFQSMASRRKIWNVSNKDEAVLWLWSAHNEVNQRLAGDATEDPQFPKIQFPSYNSCAKCYRESTASSSSMDIKWNRDAVLSFLKNIHNPEFVSHYGVDREVLLHATSDKLRQKRQITSVFTDMDMRMGMLLYAFCIIMMVVAFKLFAFKGYRKKPYGYDLLGKV